MKKVYSVTDFSIGINELNSLGATDLSDFDIHSDGSLATRKGYKARDAISGVSGSLMQAFFANDLTFVQTTTNLYYRSSSDTFSAVTNNTPLNSDQLAAACSGRFSVVVANSDRVFLANTSANGRFWLDTGVVVYGSGNSITTPPALYTWGIDPPTGVTFSSSAGVGLESGEYAYAFAYEGKYGAMSPLSERVIYTRESEGPVSIALPSASGLNAQIERIVIYRTEKASQVTFPEGQAHEKVLAKNAPLKRIGSVEKGSMSGGYSDASKSIGVAQLANELEKSSKPPNLMTGIASYGGRIWGFINGTSKLVFSSLDATGAPLYDLFPGEDSPIPHVIKAKDTISAIAASKEYVAIFSENSVQLVLGQGIISGIYNVQQAGTDLDVSQRLDSIGCHSQDLVSTFNGQIYFYSQSEKRVYRLDQSAKVNWVSQSIDKLVNSWEAESNSAFMHMVVNKGDVYLFHRLGANTKALRYDSFKSQWSRHWLGSNYVSYPFIKKSEGRFYQNGLYALMVNGLTNNIVLLFESSSVDDNGSAISPIYTSSVFNFSKPTRLDSIRIGAVGTAETTVYLYTDSDNETGQINPPGESKYVLNKNNNYTVRTFARGYKHQVKFQLTGAQTVRFFELQFRSR